MKLTNQEILEISIAMADSLSAEMEMPIKVAFYIQKNQNTLRKLAEEINNLRVSIYKMYGDFNEEQNGYLIRKENEEIALKKLTELLQIEQDVEIKMIKLDDLGDMKITKKMIEAISFMIEE